MAGVRHFRAVESWQSQLYEVALKFTYPGRPSWWGVFSTRSNIEGGESLACTMPNPDLCCISCLGTGYIVNAAKPEDWHFLEVQPVLHVEPVVEQQLLLANDFTRIVAYGTAGLKWRTRNLCSDQLKIVGVNGRFVDCTGWDAAKNDDIAFRVDMLSGESFPKFTS